MVHVYERYAWMVAFFIMCCLYGLGSKAGYDVHAQKPLEDTGRALSADILSFGAITFGAFASWSPIAADYNVRLPVDTNPWHVFLLTFCGVFLSITFSVTLGATLLTITDPVYVAAFGSSANTGALIAQVLLPWGGGGKFLLVMLSFSAMCVFCVLIYSHAYVFTKQCEQHSRYIFRRSLHTSSRSSLCHGTSLSLGVPRFRCLYRCRYCRTGAFQYSPHQLFVHIKLLDSILYRYRCGGTFPISAERRSVGRI